MSNEYECAMCHNVYKKGQAEKDAVNELNENFSNLTIDECVLVCDDCYPIVLENGNKNNNKIALPPLQRILKKIESKIKRRNELNPIGQLKLKAKVYCEICGCSYTRNLKGNVFEDTKEETERVKKKLAEKACAEYTCKVCKTIEEKKS